MSTEQSQIYKWESCLPPLCNGDEFTSIFKNNANMLPINNSAKWLPADIGVNSPSYNMNCESLLIQCKPCHTDHKFTKHPLLWLNMYICWKLEEVYDSCRASQVAGAVEAPQCHWRISNAFVRWTVRLIQVNPKNTSGLFHIRSVGIQGPAWTSI